MTTDWPERLDEPVPLKRWRLAPLIMRLSGGFVIAFHDIAPQRLAEFVDGLGPARVVPLTELVRRRKEGKASFGLFAITVDDGAGENVRGLARLFHAREWPATFYLPTNYLDTKEPMAFQLWWRLKPLLPRKVTSLRSGTIDFSRPGAIEALSKRLERMWYRERLESYLPLTLELVDVVARHMGIDKNNLKGPAPISWPEVTELSRGGLIQFESHGVSHTSLSALTEDEIVFELRHSQRVIQDHTGLPCRHLCYPFGSRESIGPLAPMLARHFYDSAVTMRLGSVDLADPWLLPRIPLYPENSLLFARMKVLLKCTFLSAPWRKSNLRAIEWP